MKKIFIAGFFALAALTGCGQSTTSSKVVIQTLDFAYLEGCETGKGDCKPVDIVRSHKQDSVLLVFPSGGTQSDVYLTGKKIQLHDRKFAGDGKPTLNLTGLDDGEYSAGILSCGLGGACLIRLITKQQ